MPDLRVIGSLRLRVAAIASLSVSAALLLSLALVNWAEEAKDEAAFDERLMHTAQLLMTLVSTPSSNTSAPTAATVQLASLKISDSSVYGFQVWSTQGQLLAHSPNASAVTPLLPLDSVGLQLRPFNGEPARILALRDHAQERVVLLADTLHGRDENYSFYLLPLILPLLVSLGVTSYLIRRAFRNVDAMVAQMSERNLLDVGPLRLKESPKELEPMVSAMNAMFARAGKALSMEQSFTAMAAHELRTPWAGIRAQAQIAANASTSSELQRALQTLISGVDRASHVLDQLLDLARIETMNTDVTATFEEVQLASSVTQVLADLASQAHKRQITLISTVSNETVKGLDFIVYLILRNLVSNAILYAPFGGRVEVSVQPQVGRLALYVDDSGKGIPAQQRNQAFERFNRLGQPGSDGVGLGLSIVAQAAELLRAEIELSQSPLGGLRAALYFQTA